MSSDPSVTRAVQRSATKPTALEVRVTAGPDAGQTVSCNGSMVIGVAEDVDLRLTDPTVSRYHVELEPSEAGIRMRDLGSRNGTYIDRTRIDQGTLAPETELSLGNTRLTIGSKASDEPTEESTDVEIPGFVASGPAMKRVASLIARAAKSDVSVLLQGETGTGKEVAARGIHSLSGRHERPFVVVDCGSLPPTLIASELFGHERGSFTGAERLHKGAFERAEGGTVFLDEIGELPAELQPNLLGVLERRSFRRVGGEEDLTANIRLIAASHRDLRSAANTGEFRADLYFRLAVARIVIPPLRERREEIVELIGAFVEELTGDAKQTPFDAKAMSDLLAYHWGGNVRELRNVVEAALAMGQVELHHDGEPITTEGEGDVQPYRLAKATVVEHFERTYLKRLMDQFDQNASRAAAHAKMDRPYLLRLLKRHGLRKSK